MFAMPNVRWEGEYTLPPDRQCHAVWRSLGHWQCMKCKLQQTLALASVNYSEELGCVRIAGALDGRRPIAGRAEAESPKAIITEARGERRYSGVRLWQRKIAASPLCPVLRLLSSSLFFACSGRLSGCLCPSVVIMLACLLACIAQFNPSATVDLQIVRISIRFEDAISG